MLFGKKQEIAHAETTVHARAKINLTLDVTGQREDGYHTVQMVMQSVALHDEVKVTVTHGEKKPRGIILTCDLPYLPVDERNLAYRAAELFYKETGTLLETCEIHIEKRIPIAAGLAGGSSDAAAVLRALAALHATGLTDDELCAMGLKLGAVRYLGDQPRGISGSHMFAFHAQAQSDGPIVCQASEIAHAHWVARDALQPGAPSMSIAFALMERFRQGTL